MVAPEALEDVDTWLNDQLPGGKWIAPHWQDGPFWLVPVEDSKDADWQAQIVLDAHDPLVGELTILLDWEYLTTVALYAVSQFSYETLLWHRTETGLNLADDHIVGPFPSVPGPTEVVEHLEHLLGINDDAADELAEILSALRSAPASAVVAALGAGIKPDGANDKDALRTVLVTVAGILSDT